MSDMVREAESIFAGASLFSAAMHLRQKRIDAEQFDRRVCGSCTKWMKSGICPAERNANGRTRGPNMNSAACGQFDLEPWVAAEKAKLMAEVEQAEAELAAKRRRAVLP